MAKNSQLLVIVFISTAQLALTLLAVAWMFGCLHDETQEAAIYKTNDINEFVAKQAIDRIEDLGLQNVELNNSDWVKLQNFVVKTKLLGDGFLSVIDSQSGAVVCHPEIENDPSILGKNWNGFLVQTNKSTLLEALQEAKLQNKKYAQIQWNGDRQLVVGTVLSGLGLTVLTHHRMAPNHATESSFISSFQGLAFAGALAIGLLATVLNIFMTKRINAEDTKVHSDLNQLVEARTAELICTKNAIIFGLAKLAESRDNDTGEHLDRIRKYVTILAKDLVEVYDEIDEEFIYNLGIASSLHDIGKVGIPDSILLKPGKLTSLERSIMEKHAVIGGECLEAIGTKLGDNDFLEMAREVAYWHHEQWDGMGYPHRLADEQIPISARIVAVADVYDALTSRRPYKRGMSHTESRAIILSGSGQKFDPEVVAAFLRHETAFQTIARRHQNTDFEKPIYAAAALPIEAPFEADAVVAINSVD